jgi:uncharacterized protein (DUF433 family)/DNA-binding transcriptional MerR regulator
VDRPSPLAAAYPADRAAALAGIPKTTLYYWARTGLVVPGVSRTKVKRWSYSDLLVLRLVEWLRRDKPDLTVPRSSMRQIRWAMEAKQDLGEELRSQRFHVFVDRQGGLVLRGRGEFYVPLASKLVQGLVPSEVDLVSAFHAFQGIVGPDLATPRPSLRIIPGKLSGEPHVAETRIQTKMLAALQADGFDAGDIVALYPDLSRRDIGDALDLEDQLHRNLRAA